MNLGICVTENPATDAMKRIVEWKNESFTVLVR